MKIRPRGVAATFAFIAICCGLPVMLRPRVQAYPLAFPGGELRKITYFNDGGKIYEVRAFKFVDRDEKKAREIGRLLQKDGHFAVEKDFATGEVFVYTARSATPADYFRQWTISGRKIEMIKGPPELTR